MVLGTSFGTGVTCSNVTRALVLARALDERRDRLGERRAVERNENTTLEGLCRPCAMACAEAILVERVPGRSSLPVPGK
jgi:hypothetical protein